MYKAVISDLDGTLLNSQHRISDLTRNTLRKLVDGGVRFMVASGRHMIDLRGIRDTLGFNCGLISANGTVASNADDDLLFQHTLPAELAIELINDMPRTPGAVDINVFRHDGWYVDREMPEWLQYHQESGFVYTVAELPKLDMHSINKVFFTGEHSLLLDVERELQRRYAGAAHIVFSLPDCLEVMPANVNKGSAVKEALEAEGIALEEALAFGDAMNDFEMLTVVGHGVVMANATATLNKALPHHPRAGTCDEDGVAQHLIEVFGL